jgi:tRNA threonylcarbamoyl adenosine modification protein YeaZ
MELAIDASTDFAGIALSHEGATISELTWHSAQRHTVELVPNIERMLSQMNVDRKSLCAIFVAKGPGSFNGLRVGISTAKGLAFALKLPLFGISTLEIEAYPFAFTKLLLCPVHNAGRGEIATAFYRQDGEWRCLEEEHITTVEMLCQRIECETIFCGEIPEPVIQELRWNLGNKAVIPDAAARLRHASNLAVLGWQRFKKGEQDNPANLQPSYLRQPPITQRKVP